MFRIARHFEITVVLAFTLLPALVGLTRDPVINFFVSRAGIQVIEGKPDKNINCRSGICEKRTKFVIPATIKDFEVPSVGYFSAFTDSWIKVNNTEIDSIQTRNELQVTWYKFHAYRIPKSSQQAGTYIDVVSASPPGTKKIGMNEPHLFLGDYRGIESLKDIYHFYNIHLYLLCALFVLLVTTLLVSTNTGRDNRTNRQLTGYGLLCILGLLAYSHYFDGILASVGVPQSFVDGLPRAFWGIVILYGILDSRKAFLGTVVLYLAAVLPGLVDWSMKDFFLAFLYRWVVALVTVGCLVHIILVRDKLRFLPIVCLMTADSLVLQNIISLHAGLYVSPLGFAGLPFVKYIRSLLAVLQHHFLWYRKNSITELIGKLRDSGGTQADWQELLAKTCTSIAQSLDANRVSICYLGLDAPLIVSYKDGGITKYHDNSLPPVFARIIQTGESLWWTHEQVLRSFLPLKDRNTPKQQYASPYATILPIKCGGDIYGAVSLTDIRPINEILRDPDQRSYHEGVVTSFLDLLSGQMVKKHETTVGSASRTVNELISAFSARSVRTKDKITTIRAFMAIVREKIHCRTMFFEYDPSNDHLSLIASDGVQPEIHEGWAKLPFRVRKENKISPFAIAVHEKRSVFIEDIQIFFKILFSESVNVLQSTATKSFHAVPVAIGDKVLGLLCLVDPISGPPISKEIEYILESPVKYLAYRLDQIAAEATLTLQEQALARLAAPELVERVTHSRNNESVIGNVIDAFIIIQDMRGSTVASRAEKDPEAYAKKLSEIYNLAQSIASSYGGFVDRVAGDGLVTIVPVDNGNADITIMLALDYLSTIGSAAKRLLRVSRTLVVMHRGCIFRGLLGHRNRMASDLCGPDINDAFLIEKESKKRDGTVLALSQHHLLTLTPSLQKILGNLAVQKAEISGLAGQTLFFTDGTVTQLKLVLDQIRKAA